MRAFGYAAVTTLMALALSGPSASAEEDIQIAGVTWLAEDIGGAGVVDNVASTLVIDAAGRASGSGGCNRFNGMAKIEDAKIAFGPLATSRKMCPPAVMDQERKFLQALERTSSFEIEGTFLRLLGEDGVALLRLVKSE